MESWMKVSISICFIFAFCGEKSYINAQKCYFPAIFNFGDSNSDTGGSYSISQDNVPWPNGITVGKVFKRVSDGRLIIDFLAESLGFPYLNSSLDTYGTSFRYGANFAVGGQRINPDPNPDPNQGHIWDYYLDEQVSRFFNFKKNAIESKESEFTNIYPKPEVFSEALYTIDIGQNDVNSQFGFKPVSTILDYFTNSVKRLLNDGAKYIWIHNTGPLGCTPLFENLCLGTNTSYARDNIGCNAFMNKLSQDFNSELKNKVYMLRYEYPNAVITLVDIYSAKSSLITNDNDFDKELKFKICCGANGVSCGYYNEKKEFGGACNDPSKYISWDGKHYTEAANKAVAKLIVDGAFSEPNVAFSEACH